MFDDPVFDDFFSMLGKDGTDEKQATLRELRRCIELTRAARDAYRKLAEKRAHGAG